jgi:two-component system C4-dicarboxylate transport sensor histidine kinase DctB
MSIARPEPRKTLPDRWQWLAFGAVALALAALVVALAGQYGAAQADHSLTERGQAAAQLQVAALEAELDKQRAVPFLVARDADVLSALQQPDQGKLSQLDAKLETLSEGVRAAVIYIIDAEGLAVAASNYRTDTSFVGNNYAFRSYFRDAMANGTARLFALGTVSQRPGLYLAERIDGPAGPLGVVVVKVEFDAIEATWQAAGGTSYVMDERGVVLLSDIADWRFRTQQAISAEMAERLRDSLQFGGASLVPLPVEPAEVIAPVEIVTASLPTPQTAIRLATAIPDTDWTLYMLLPVATDRASAVSSTRALGLLALVPLLLGAALLLAHLQRNRRAQARQTAQHAALEAGIAARTADLTSANQQLTKAMGERAQAESREAQLRDDLAQSNRLAVLGQIAAGVAHEINQPVGAIRAYAENGVTLLERQSSAQASDNLRAITSLTERIGAITEQLRGFARKGQRSIAPVDLSDAVTAALTLLGAPIRSHTVTIDFAPPHEPVPVLADRMGLEQIIVNLVQNALEALSTTPDPHLRLTIEQAAETTTLTVADNGPGIAPDIFAQLFVPFSTSKPRGLGLGLVISHDLAVSFGGTLSAEAPTGHGASFTLTLRRAP